MYRITLPHILNKINTKVLKVQNLVFVIAN